MEEKTLMSVVFIAVLLAVIQFLVNRSIWLDEAYLGLNILNKDFGELFLPLDNIQVAPILYLLIVKMFSEFHVLGTDYSLRLFSLFSFITAALVFYKITLKLFIDKYSNLFAICLFLFCPVVIYYSSELKQYSSDIAVACISIYLALRVYNNQIRNNFITLLLFGILSIFLSNIAPIILFITYAYILITNFSSIKECIKLHFLLLLTWSVTFIISYICFIHNHPSRSGQIEEWSYYKGFMPLSLDMNLFSFLADKIKLISNSLFGSSLYSFLIFIGLSISGFYYFVINKKFNKILLLLGPLILHLILSGLKLYPVSERTMIYTFPGLILFLGFGFYNILKISLDDLNIKRFRLFLIIIPSIFLIKLIYVNFPIRKLELKNSLVYINNNMKVNDNIYVSYLTSFPFKFYTKINQAVQSKNSYLGSKTMYWQDNRGWSADTTLFKNDLLKLSGRTWFVYTDIGDERDKINFMKTYFFKNGIKMIDSKEFKGSEIYLYEIDEK